MCNCSWAGSFSLLPVVKRFLAGMKHWYTGSVSMLHRRCSIGILRVPKCFANLVPPFFAIIPQSLKFESDKKKPRQESVMLPGRGCFSVSAVLYYFIICPRALNLLPLWRITMRRFSINLPLLASLAAVAALMLLVSFFT